MTTTRKNKPGQGRKPLGLDRGGLVMISANIFADQAEKLRAMEERGMAQVFIRIALDEAFKRQADAAKRVAAKNKELGVDQEESERRNNRRLKAVRLIDGLAVLPTKARRLIRSLL